MGLRRSTRVTDTDMLAVDVGVVLEQAQYPCASNVGRLNFTEGYTLILKRRSVQVCYVDNRQGRELEKRQAVFAERIGPMLSLRFGANRVKAITLMGVRRGFEVSLG